MRGSPSGASRASDTGDEASGSSPNRGAGGRAVRGRDESKAGWPDRLPGRAGERLLHWGRTRAKVRRQGWRPQRGAGRVFGSGRPSRPPRPVDAGSTLLGDDFENCRPGDQQVHAGATSFATPLARIAAETGRRRAQAASAAVPERVKARRRGGRQQCRPLFAHSAHGRNAGEAKTYKRGRRGGSASPSDPRLRGGRLTARLRRDASFSRDAAAGHVRLICTSPAGSKRCDCAKLASLPH